MLLLGAVLTSALIVPLRCVIALNDEFHEELFIKPLQNNFVYTFFQFTTQWNTSVHAKTFDNCELFPRSLGELLGRYSVSELHVSLTKGLWRHEFWGYPLVEAPPGAEIFAWFNSSRVDEDWKGLCGGLSGLLCASLNFIDTENTMTPELSFFKQGPLNYTHLRYATLPRETVCTENLTPWLKLLPCSKVGLSALLTSDYIYNTVYHSVGLHFKPVFAKDGSVIGVELKQTLSLVYDLVVVGRGGESDWSIARLFLQGISQPCPIAKTSYLYVDVSSNQTNGEFILKPAPTKPFNVFEVTRGGSISYLAVYDLKPQRFQNLEFIYTKPPVQPVNIPPPIYAKRFITGYGQEFGGLTTEIYNKHWAPVTVTFLENIPWFVPVYFHTLKVTTNGEVNKPLAKRYYVGKDREKSYCVEVVLVVAARSVTRISIEMDYSFLKWLEYPPDANHGFYVGAAVISAQLPVARNYTSLPFDIHPNTIHTLVEGASLSSVEGYPLRLTTEVLILSLPTPDFSMPYNVICLACTVVALAFGPLHNITTKKFVIVIEAKEKKSLLRNLLSKLKGILCKLIWREEKTEETQLNSSKPEDETKKDR